MLRRVLVLACAAGAAFGFLVLPGLVFDAPLAYNLFFTQKIFYYHVPAAILMFTAAITSGVAAAGYLKTRKGGWDDVAAAAAWLTVIFGAITLTTGPIWAKPAWGKYWVWEARLTTALLLWLIFVAYGIVRRFGGPGSDRLASGLAVFGAINVPLVYYSVNVWRTMHPTTDVIPTLVPEMMKPFLLGTLAYHLLFVVLLAARAAVLRAERRLENAQELALDAGVE
jgi:heme exporter protein C